MTHMSGAGCANEGDVFFTATTGPIVTQVGDFQTPYSHQARVCCSRATTRCNFCSGAFNAELTATARTGVARFTFPAGQAGKHTGSHQPYA